MKSIVTTYNGVRSSFCKMELRKKKSKILGKVGLLMLLCLVYSINLFCSVFQNDDFISQVISLFRVQQEHLGYYIKPFITSHVLLAIRWYLTLSGWFICPFQILLYHLCICLFESSKENAHCWFHSSALVCNKVQVCMNKRCDMVFFWIGCFRKSYF